MAKAKCKMCSPGLRFKAAQVVYNGEQRLHCWNVVQKNSAVAHYFVMVARKNSCWAGLWSTDKRATLLPKSREDLSATLTAWTFCSESTLIRSGFSVFFLWVEAFKPSLLEGFSDFFALFWVCKTGSLRSKRSRPVDNT